MKRPKISIVGSGNVAFTLATALNEAGFSINQIAGRNIREVQKLATRTHSDAVSIDKLDFNTDVILLCIADDAIAAIAKKIGIYDGVIIHCSGSIPLDILPQKNKAVLYPFISMKKENKTDLNNADIFIEAGSDKAKKTVALLAKSISKHVKSINSQQRLHLHIAAVFAHNFVNHQMHLAQMILKQHGMKFDLLEKLITSYFAQLKIKTPDKLQTGPAMRKDNEIIKKHLKLLDGNADLKKIYQIMTNNIQKLDS
jgi:predicted short-subunit dehydrogenase-like oxidoreductase (DUF2520 family)